MKRGMLVVAAALLFAGCGVSGGGSGVDEGSGTSGDNSTSGNTGSGDVTAPSIVATAPCDCGANIVADAPVAAVFSETIDSSSLNADTFTVKNSFKNISGSISYAGSVATFKPFSNLSSNTWYVVTLNGIKDTSGNAMSEPKQWEFHTGTATSTQGARYTDVQGIFTSKCISCHTSGGTSSFLPLTNDVAYANIVGRQSNYTSGLIVSNGKSLESALYKRVSGTTAGAQMPKDSAALSSEEQHAIKTWIDEGALYN